MMLNSTPAWLLATEPSGETSLRAVFFTREQGVMSCLCKGWRQAKKRSLMQPFLPLWIAVHTRGSWHYLRELELLSTSLIQLRGDNLFAAHYLNELLYYSLKPAMVETALFDAYQSTLHGLETIENKVELERLLRRFEWHLLSCLGYSFSLTHDAQDGQAIEASLQYQWQSGQGFYRAAEGISGEHILALSEDNLEAAETLKAAKWMMRRAIHDLLDGRPLKSRELFQS